MQYQIIIHLNASSFVGDPVDPFFRFSSSSDSSASAATVVKMLGFKDVGESGTAVVFGVFRDRSGVLSFGVGRGAGSQVDRTGVGVFSSNAQKPPSLEFLD